MLNYRKEGEEAATVPKKPFYKTKTGIALIFILVAGIIGGTIGLAIHFSGPSEGNSTKSHYGGGGGGRGGYGGGGGGKTKSGIRFDMGKGLITTIPSEFTIGEGWDVVDDVARDMTLTADKKLGSGNFSGVALYKGSGETTYAVKKYHWSSETRDAFARRNGFNEIQIQQQETAVQSEFTKEVQMLQQFGPDSLPQLFAFSEPRRVIVMQAFDGALCPGADVTTGQLNGCLGLSNAGRDFEIMNKVFENIIPALATFHSDGLVYHDMKPENIVVNGDGTPRRWTSVTKAMPCDAASLARPDDLREEIASFRAQSGYSLEWKPPIAFSILFAPVEDDNHAINMLSPQQDFFQNGKWSWYGTPQWDWHALYRIAAEYYLGRATMVEVHQYNQTAFFQSDATVMERMRGLMGTHPILAGHRGILRALQRGGEGLGAAVDASGITLSADTMAQLHAIPPATQ